MWLVVTSSASSSSGKPPSGSRIEPNSASKESDDAFFGSEPDGSASTSPPRARMPVGSSVTLVPPQPGIAHRGVEQGLLPRLDAATGIGLGRHPGPLVRPPAGRIDREVPVVRCAVHDHELELGPFDPRPPVMNPHLAGTAIVPARQHLRLYATHPSRLIFEIIANQEFPYGLFLCRLHRIVGPQRLNRGPGCSHTPGRTPFPARTTSPGPYFCRLFRRIRTRNVQQEWSDQALGMRRNTRGGLVRESSPRNYQNRNLGRGPPAAKRVPSLTAADNPWTPHG